MKPASRSNDRIRPAEELTSMSNPNQPSRAPRVLVPRRDAQRVHLHGAPQFWRRDDLDLGAESQHIKDSMLQRPGPEPALNPTGWRGQRTGAVPHPEAGRPAGESHEFPAARREQDMR